MVILLGMENIKILYEIKKNGHTIKSANVVWKVCSWGNSTNRSGSRVTLHMSCEGNQQSIYPAHIFHENVNSHLNVVLQYRCLTNVETCVCILQDFFNHCIKTEKNAQILKFKTEIY